MRAALCTHELIHCEPARQADLFESAGETTPVDRAIDAIRDRFGDRSVARGGSLRTEPEP